MSIVCPFIHFGRRNIVHRNHDYEVKLTQLADDTTLFINNLQSFKNCISILKDFQSCSGLKLNYSKTEILPLGTHTNLQEAPVKIVDKAFSLGIWYLKSMDDVISENYNKKITNLTHTLNKWKARNLTIIGRCTVIKTLISPKINHITANLQTPDWFVKDVQTLIDNFIWQNKPPKIKSTIIRNTPEMGGLRLPDIDISIKAQKISWIKRIINNPNAAWLQHLYTQLPNMNIIDILKCSMDDDDLNKLPEFYKQVFDFWFSSVDTPKDALDVRRQSLWINKNIKINNKTLSNIRAYEKGIKLINDILDNNGQILRYTAFTNKYNIHISPFKYMSIVDAIPREWRQLIKNCNFPPYVIKDKELPHLKINDQYKNITQIKSNEIYLKLLKQQEKEPSCISNWNTRLNLDLQREDWAYIFTLPKTLTKNTLVIETQFKILHRYYATNSLISKWDNTKTDTCSTCHQKANILHNFITCTTIQAFWRELQEHLNNNDYGIDTELTTQDIIFGKYKNSRYFFCNHLLLHAKHYIHKQYIQSLPTTFPNFLHYYKYILTVEHQIYTANDEVKTFTKNFGKMFNILQNN